MEKILRQHWEESKMVNQNLIIQNTMQIEMAKEVIKLCDLKIAEFPVEKQSKTPEIPKTPVSQ